MQLQQMSVMGLANLPVQVAVAHAKDGVTNRIARKRLRTDFIDP